MRLPHKVGSNVQPVLSYTARVGVQQRSMEVWRSSVVSLLALVSTNTAPLHCTPELVLSNLSGCREHGHVL